MVWKCSAFLLSIPLLVNTVAEPINVLSAEHLKRTHVAKCTQQRIDVFISQDIAVRTFGKEHFLKKFDRKTFIRRRHHRRRLQCLGTLDPIPPSNGTIVGYGGSIAWSECPPNSQSHVFDFSSGYEFIYNSALFLLPHPFLPLKVSCRCAIATQTPLHACHATFQFDETTETPTVILPSNQSVINEWFFARKPFKVSDNRHNQNKEPNLEIIDSVKEGLNYHTTIEILDAPTETSDGPYGDRLTFRSETFGLGRKYVFPNECRLKLMEGKFITKPADQQGNTMIGTDSINIIEKGCPSSTDWDVRIDGSEIISLSENSPHDTSEQGSSFTAYRLIVSFSLSNLFSNFIPVPNTQNDDLGERKKPLPRFQLYCEMDFYDEPPLLKTVCFQQPKFEQYSNDSTSINLAKYTQFPLTNNSTESHFTGNEKDNSWSEISRILGKSMEPSRTSGDMFLKQSEEQPWIASQEELDSGLQEKSFSPSISMTCDPVLDNLHLMQLSGTQQLKVTCRELTADVQIQDYEMSSSDQQIVKILQMHHNEKTWTSLTSTLTPNDNSIKDTLLSSLFVNHKKQKPLEQEKPAEHNHVQVWRKKRRRWDRHNSRRRNTRKLFGVYTNETRHEQQSDQMTYYYHSVLQPSIRRKIYNSTSLSNAVPVKPQWSCVQNVGHYLTESWRTRRRLSPEEDQPHSNDTKFLFRNYIVPNDIAAIELQEQELWSSNNETFLLDSEIVHAETLTDAKTVEAMNIVQPSDADVDSDWETQLYEPRVPLRGPNLPARKNRGILGSGIGRDVPLSQTSIYRAVNLISYGPWISEWARDKLERTEEVQVGNDVGFVQAGVSAVQKELAFSTGWRNLITSLSYNEIRQEVGYGLALGPYGVNVDRSQNYRATAVEILARGVESGTLIDFVDRNFGQRLKVRNFEISIRHDFDDYFYPSDTGFGTEVLVAYRGVSAALATDIREKRLGITIGVRGYSVAFLHDFDNFLSLIQANWGRGWQLAMESDFPDEYSLSTFVGAGVGKLNRFFGQIGFGIGDDGVPQASARLQTRNIGLGVDFLDEFGQRVFQYAITVGRFTYIWQVNVDLTNVRIPNLLGIQPTELENFLLSLIPKREYPIPHHKHNITKQPV